MKFEGKVALVTGSARGIGRGTALAFAEQGAAIAVNYRRSKEQAYETARLVREMRVEAHVLHADVGFKDDVDRLITQVFDRFGRLDYLINNAGGGGGGTFLGADEEQFDFGLRNNLKSSFLCSQRAARQMIDQGSGGAIINISSVAASLHYPDHAIYGVAKKALEKLTEAQALELAEHNIRVNAISPGYIDTRFSPGDRGSKYEEQHQRNLANIPLRRGGKPVDIGRAAVFLCSDESHYTTGAVLVVDGGLFLVPNY